ncbi:unnamed protein product [Adineta steineri]|uniref:EF-hand domain-containing protein n=4 Tax=Adineta steineri TaxID=433720 RepID=A0A815HET3_9BILA|nr:unnamed protein product [Adineta steineri]CAF1259530.1 unnamed protein product [Adineta steineri]CAF1334388.1 unnamed protein product [Adineta steineri]CAF1349842.1 unnamed protein product [Adineta steineri]CAF1543878.1 unnamed protein product [Adineta steineri]
MPKEKGKAPKKPAKTDKQKKAEAEMMRKVVGQYNGVLSKEDIIGMKEIFDTYDGDNQGFIKASNLGLILRTLGFNPRDSDLQRVGKEYDPERTDRLKFPEFVASILSIPTTITDKEIIPAFQVFDLEKRGVLEADEILKCLTNVGEMLDEAEAKAFKDNLKPDDLGLFNYTDFVLKFTEPKKKKKKGKKKGKKKK